MNFAFQDRENLYLVMDLLTGGDLRFHIGKQKRFKEVQTKFFVACIMLALEYLHNKNIIHRDIKPENLVLEKDGYVRVTDLGIARYWKPENSQDTSGTPGYMAPEVMCRQNHGIGVDYFAVGVIGYQFMMGRRPYLGRSRKEIRDQILAQQVQIRKHEIPDGWSIDAADFINRDNFDYRQQISVDGQDSNEDLIQQNSLLLRRNSVQRYNYDMNNLNQLNPSKNVPGGGGTGSTATSHQSNNTHTQRSVNQ